MDQNKQNLCCIKSNLEKPKPILYIYNQIQPCMNWFKRKPHFSTAELEQIKLAIDAAEMLTSGEIKVYVENYCKSDNPVQRAVECFAKLKMDTTAERNGVLIYLAIKDKKFSIIGDEGIHQQVGTDFWEQEKNILQQHLKSGKIVEGICSCIATIGGHLQKYFPHKDDDKNELSNEVVIG